jgi:hypothetical protein
MNIDRSFDCLSKVKHIHKGKRAFVVGSGSSIDCFDWSVCVNKDDIILAVNQSVTALDKCNYFCMTDGANIESNFFQYGVSICDKVIMANGYFFDLPAFIDQYDLFRYKTYIFNRRYNDIHNHNFNLQDGLLIAGTDVVHVTAHLAHIMGCSPIFLIGVDLNYDNHKKYCAPTKFKQEVKWSNNTPKCMLETTQSGLYDPFLNESFHTWKEIKQQNSDISFINLNPQSRLTELFETKTI